MSNMRADEIAGALDGLDTAKGSKANPAPPANSEGVYVVKHFTIDRSQNVNSALNGQLYAVMDFVVESCTSPNAPPGSTVGVFCGGLDSRVNKGSLAQTNMDALRRLLAAVLGVDPNAPPPQVPATQDNPKPIQGWNGIAAFLAKHPPAGTRIRIVAGNAKPGKPVYPDQMQFFPAVPA